MRKDPSPTSKKLIISKEKSKQLLGKLMLGIWILAILLASVLAGPQ